MKAVNWYRLGFNVFLKSEKTTENELEAGQEPHYNYIRSTKAFHGGF
jgi:hypothetical protein